MWPRTPIGSLQMWHRACPLSAMMPQRTQTRSSLLDAGAPLETAGCTIAAAQATPRRHARATYRATEAARW
jgi:hypothetical protein